MREDIDNKTDGSLCCHFISSGRWSGGYTCNRRAKVYVDGKAYCGTHDPQKELDRQEAHRKKLQSKMSVFERNALVDKVARKVLTAAVAFIDMTGDAEEGFDNLAEAVKEYKEALK